MNFLIPIPIMQTYFQKIGIFNHYKRRGCFKMIHSKSPNGRVTIFLSADLFIFLKCILGRTQFENRTFLKLKERVTLIKRVFKPRLPDQSCTF